MRHRRGLSLRRRRLPVLVVIGCAALTAVGASASSPAAGPRVAFARVAGAPTTAWNRQAAVQDAQSLVSDVVPPAGAVLQSSGTAIGSHAHLLTEALASAVADSTWTVPADPAEVLASVEGNLPPGSSIVGTGSGTVHRIVRLFNSLGVAQPAVINCPAELVSPTVDIQFRSSSTDAPIARATVSSTAVFHFSPVLGGADCFPIAMTIAIGVPRSSAT